MMKKTDKIFVAGHKGLVGSAILRKLKLKGYKKIINELEEMLYKVTGFDAVSFQPNSGAQGEYAGLLSIREYHKANNSNRDICLIPESAHGTNPASAIMAGLKVVIVKCDDHGNTSFVCCPSFYFIC